MTQSGQSEQPDSRGERGLADAEASLANELEKLADVEDRLGMSTDAKRRRDQAADLDRRAKEHVEHVRQDLEEEERRRRDGRPKG